MRIGLPADGAHGSEHRGTEARELFSRVVTEDVSNEAFRFMAIRPMEIGLSPALVGRITFTGDLGYAPPRFGSGLSGCAVAVSVRV